MAGCSEPMKNVAPRPITKSAPPIPAVRSIRQPQRLSLPARRVARSRDPTAIAARKDTVMAVPIAMAKVAKTPAHISPWEMAKTRTMIAPVQGRMPTENAIASACGQDQGPVSWSGDGI